MIILIYFTPIFDNFPFLGHCGWLVAHEKVWDSCSHLYTQPRARTIGSVHCLSTTRLAVDALLIASRDLSEFGKAARPRRLSLPRQPTLAIRRSECLGLAARDLHKPGKRRRPLAAPPFDPVLARKGKEGERPPRPQGACAPVSNVFVLANVRVPRPQATLRR
jgi:hypothetical protein